MQTTDSMYIFMRMLSPEAIQTFNDCISELQDHYRQYDSLFEFDPQHFSVDVFAGMEAIYIGKVSALPGDAFFDCAMNGQLLNECFIKAVYLAKFGKIFTDGV